MLRRPKPTGALFSGGLLEKIGFVKYNESSDIRGRGFALRKAAPFSDHLFSSFTMYAIFKDGGRQHKVEVGTRLMIDYRGEDAEAGTTVEFDQVLALSHEGDVKIGQPTVTGAKVIAEVIGMEKGPKLIIAKFRRRKNSKRKTGHRQKYTLVKINEIVS